MSIWKNGKLVAGGSQALPLLTFVWADHILDDISWLRADTFSWQSGSIYQAVYQHLANDIDGKSLQSETIGSTTIQFYLADDGHKICPESEMSNVAAIYAAKGVAWYYIIDTANQRFKLPRTKFAFTGLRDTVGKYIAAGLPNITGNFYIDSYYNPSATGAFTQSDNYSAPNHGNWAAEGWKINLDASLSSVVYGNSDTVQPRATEMYLYFYVGEFTQAAIENTAGVVTEDFNELNAHKVIAFQAPTAQNNYTWYRKYADGWVEQGGQYVGIVGVSTGVSITLPVTMTDANYTLNITGEQNSSNWAGAVIRNGTRTTTGFQAYVWGGGSGDQIRGLCWVVQGMAA